MEIDENCSSTCLSSLFQKEYDDQFVIDLNLRIDLKEKTLQIVRKEPIPGDRLNQKDPLTEDEIFDRFEGFLSKTQIKNLFKKL